MENPPNEKMFIFPQVGYINNTSRSIPLNSLDGRKVYFPSFFDYQLPQNTNLDTPHFSFKYKSISSFTANVTGCMPFTTFFSIIGRCALIVRLAKKFISRESLIAE